MDLSLNPFTTFPEDLSVFKKLSVLDLTSIQFEDIEAVINSLATLPRLVDLKINLSTQNEALLVLNTLPNLNYLNGKSTKEDTHLIDMEDKEVEDISLNNEIPNFNYIFTKISEKLKLNSKEMNKEFFDEFQAMLKLEISKINQSVDNTIPNYIYATNVISSKQKIFYYFYEKLQQTNQSAHDSDSSQLARDLTKNIKESSDQLINIIMKLYPKISEKTDNLKQQLEEALKGAQVVDNEITSFEDKIRQATNERDLIIKQTQEETQMLREKVERLEKENKIMTEKLLENAKRMITSNNDGLEELASKAIIGRDSMRSAKEDPVNESYAKSHLAARKENLNMSSSSQPVLIGSRVLTVKMLKDVINEIYNSKMEYDKKCLEFKMPRETMEQHMYYFLNKKYGLKVFL